MKRIITTLGLIYCLSLSMFGQKVEIVKFNSVQKILDLKGEGIQIINFWATWCAPCVKELPLIEELSKKDSNINVTLINLNFAEEIDKVNGFIVKKKISSKVLLLDELDYNMWINKIDKNWSGAIPATLILNSMTGKRKFIEKELTKDELQNIVEEVIR